jgi:hypothetical protein
VVGGGSAFIVGKILLSSMFVAPVLEHNTLGHPSSRFFCASQCASSDCSVNRQPHCPFDCDVKTDVTTSRNIRPMLRSLGCIIPFVIRNTMSRGITTSPISAVAAPKEMPAMLADTTDARLNVDTSCYIVSAETERWVSCHEM